MPSTSIVLNLTHECWLFLRTEDPEAMPLRLSDEVKTLLAMANFRPDSSLDVRYRMAMLRAHAWERVEYVGSTYGALPADDSRRRLCEACLEALDKAIRGAQSE